VVSTTTALTALALALGCGGESNLHQNDGHGAGGKAGSGGAEQAGFPSSGEGGGFASGGLGATGGAGSGAVPFPCGEAQPVLGAATGLERCSGGYLRRTAPAHCPSTLPRSGSVPNYNAAIDSCESDRDCPSATWGPYAHCATREGGYANACVSGCIEDADCTADRVCLCEEPVGRCVPATCATSADCGASLECASYASSPGCFSTQFSCQLPTDACGGDADCNGRSVNVSFCVAEQGARVCSTAQCTTP
jgi:hypothetical protein